MEGAVDFITAEILEFGVIALVDGVDADDLEDNLFKLALVEGTLADAPYVVEVEGVMLFDVFFVVGKEVVVDLEMTKSTAPFFVDTLFVSFTHSNDFFVLGVVIILGVRLMLEIFHMLNGLILLLI